MATQMRYAARSDIGMRRKGNEDSGFADSHLLMVADGMGGHAAGELASAMAVATFAEIAEEEIPEGEVLTTLNLGIGTLTQRIGDVIVADPSNQGMGTTVTGMYWNGDRVGIVHVGDSRAYRLRDGQLDQVTKDHTYVQTLVDSGEISAEAAAVHPRRNLLIRAVDGIHPVEAEVSMRETKVGDRYLLCSDGLTGVISDAALAEVLCQHSDPTSAVTHLVDTALEGGAPDNVTVVVADVQSVPEHTVGGIPVVVGAAGEPGNRARLPNVPWPIDEQLDPDDPQPRSTQVDTHTPVAADTQPIEKVTDPESPRHNLVPRWALVAVAVLGSIVVVLAIVGASLLWWLQAQWYVSEDNGNVAIYRGVPGTLGPIPLQKLESSSNTPVSELPTFQQERVEVGITTPTFEAAQELVAELDELATDCADDPTTPGCPKPDPKSVEDVSMETNKTPVAS
jgi:serine/threonine protein phosphatase PrpC